MSCTARSLYYERLGSALDEAVLSAQSAISAEALMLSNANDSEANPQASAEEHQLARRAESGVGHRCDAAKEDDKRKREEAEAEDAIRAFKAKQVSGVRPSRNFCLNTFGILLARCCPHLP